MIRCSCSHAGIQLALTNMESHKREPGSERLLPDSGAANASLAKGLTMPTIDPIQIKPRDGGRLIHTFPVFLRTCGEDQAIASL